MNIKLEALDRNVREALETFRRKGGTFFLLDQGGFPVGVVAFLPALPPLPSFDSGGTLVDLADRDALYAAMEEGDPKVCP